MSRPLVSRLPCLVWAGWVAARSFFSALSALGGFYYGLGTVTVPHSTLRSIGTALAHPALRLGGAGGDWRLAPSRSGPHYITKILTYDTRMMLGM
jgi:hypothetical protein